jgi:hypothetical protein
MPKIGYIEDFEKKLSSLVKSGVSFRIEMSGMTRVIHFLDAYGNTTNKSIYFGHKHTKRMEGLELVTGVRSELKKRIQDGEKAPSFVKGTKVVAFHIPNLVSASESEKPIAELDINACYWTTAHKLGFISDELFEKGWKKRRTAKIGLLTAIGSLNKSTYIENFGFGKSEGIEKTKKDDEYRPYYWAVINEVNNLMNKAINAIPEKDFLMWLTDCIYLKKESADLIKKFFDDYGYEYKECESTIEKVDAKRVHWVNHKTGESKYIFYSTSVRVK